MSEWFAEVSVPILADKPFAKSLTVDASVRTANYSTVGTTTSFAYGAVWQPDEQVRIKASFNRAVRAPNIAELFQPQVTQPGFLLLDVCDPNSADSEPNEFREANCAMFVPDDFDASPTLVLGGTQVTSGGNPNLDEEEADTITLGVVFTPNFVPGLTIIADYYDIDIEGGVFSTGSEELIVQNCVDSPSINNAFCSAVQRDPTTGLVQSIQAVPLNPSNIRSEGIDYQIEYLFALDDLVGADIGDFGFGVSGTYLIERDDVLFEEFPDTTNLFTEEFGFPEHFVNLTLDWTKGPWRANYGVTYQSSQVRIFGANGIEQVRAQPNLINEPDTGSAFVHYIGGAYELNESLTATLRVNNLFDRERFTGLNFNTQIRPVNDIGRTIQVGVHARF